jgi:hypothetical protein
MQAVTPCNRIAHAMHTCTVTQCGRRNRELCLFVSGCAAFNVRLCCYLGHASGVGGLWSVQSLTCQLKLVDFFRRECWLAQPLSQVMHWSLARVMKHLSLLKSTTDARSTCSKVGPGAVVQLRHGDDLMCLS